jgi:hypothetical protein
MIADLLDPKPGEIGTAWDLIGYDGGVKIVGGRTTYDSVFYDDSNPRQRRVRLDRLQPVERGFGAPPKLRTISRYVDPDELLEVIG